MIRLALLASMLASPALAQRTERFTVGPEGVDLDGEHFRVQGWNPPSGPGAPESVGLGVDEDSFALDVWTPGCAVRGGWIYVLESSDLGEPYAARFARTRAPRARAARYGEPSDVGCGDTLRFPDGTRAIIEGIEARFPEVMLVRLHIGETVADVQAQPIALTTSFDADLIVTAAIARTHGVLGTPRASLVIVRPTLVVRDARDGEEVTIARGERARLGSLFVRWGGCGEMHLTDGSGRAICQVNATVGARSGSHVLEYGAPWEFENFLIEIVTTSQDGAIFRLRRAR